MKKINASYVWSSITVAMAVFTLSTGDAYAQRGRSSPSSSSRSSPSSSSRSSSSSYRSTPSNSSRSTPAARTQQQPARTQQQPARTQQQPARTQQNTAKQQPANTSNASNKGPYNPQNTNKGATNTNNSRVNNATRTTPASNPNASKQANANSNRMAGSLNGAKTTPTKDGGTKTVGTNSRGQKEAVVQHANGTSQRITTMPNGKQVTHNYDAQGRKTSTVGANGTKTNYSFNGPKGQRSAVTHTDARGNQHTQKYTFDRSGNRNGFNTYKNGKLTGSTINSNGRYVRTTANGNSYSRVRNSNGSITRSYSYGGRTYNRTYYTNNYSYGRASYYGYGWHSSYSSFYSGFFWGSVLSGGLGYGYYPGYYNPYWYSGGYYYNHPFAWNSWGSMYNYSWYNSGYYGYYYHPYAHYRSISAWMVDYTLMSYLNDSYHTGGYDAGYQAGANAQAAADQQAINNANAGSNQQQTAQSTGITEEMKEQIRVQVEQELAARQQQSSVPLDKKFAEGEKRIWVASQSLEVTILPEEGDNTDATETCTIGDGDMLRASVSQSGGAVARVIAAKSADGQCAVGTKITITGQQLADFDTDFNAKLDETSQEASKQKLDVHQ